jgi:TIR domain
VAEVFISYSQEDRELVAPIAALLAGLGIDTWFDRQISPGESFGAVIRARLKEAKAVLVCWGPQAIQSQWVDAEADYAREVGTYVPVFIAPCALMPPFNRIHTEDLSNWTPSANDPTWLKLVDRISKLLGREGVVAAARAYASGDEKALYDFARRFPQEPVAARIWSGAETRHRTEFSARLDEARTAAAARAARITAEAADLDARIEATVPAFEGWLADERRAAAAGARPDPIALVKRHIPAEEKKLREDFAALSSALAQAKGVEEELETAKAEIARLTEQLTEKSDEVSRLREEIAPLSDATAEAKTGAQELEAAKAEVERLSKELTELKAPGQASWRPVDQVITLKEVLLPQSLPEVILTISFPLLVSSFFSKVFWTGYDEPLLGDRFEVYVNISAVVGLFLIIALLLQADLLSRGRTFSKYKIVRRVLFSMCVFHVLLCILLLLVFGSGHFSNDNMKSINNFRQNIDDSVIIATVVSTLISLGLLVIRRPHAARFWQKLAPSFSLPPRNS